MGWKKKQLIKPEDPNLGFPGYRTYVKTIFFFLDYPQTTLKSIFYETHTYGNGYN